MTGGPPARIDRAALERILRRATELQAAERDPGHDLTSDELLALGKEVGLPQRYLQQALAEERTRVGAGRDSVIGRLAGPAGTSAQRVVQGEPQQVQAQLIRYLDDHELLVVQREQPGAVLLEPIKGFQAAIRRSTAAFGRNSRGYLLDRVRSLQGTVAPLEPGYVHVALRADLRSTRAAYLGGGGAVASAGVAGAVILLVLHAFPLIALAPLVAGSGLGVGIVRLYPPKVDRVQLGLERALDYLQRGDFPSSRQKLPPKGGSLSSLIADEIRKAIK